MFLTVCDHMKSWSEVNSVLMQILLPLCVSTTNNRTVQNYPQPGNQTARSPPTCEVYTNLNHYFQITYLKPQYLWYFFKTKCFDNPRNLPFARHCSPKSFHRHPTHKDTPFSLPLLLNYRILPCLL